MKENLNILNICIDFSALEVKIFFHMKTKILFTGIFLAISLLFISDRIVSADQDKISHDLYDSIHQASYDLKPIKIWIYFKDKDFHQSNKVLSFNKKLIKRLKKSGIVGFNREEIPVKKEYIKILMGMKIYPVTESKWLNAISAVVPAGKIYDLENLDFIQKLDVVHTYARRSPVESFLSNQKIKNNQNSDSKKSLQYGNSFEQLENINFPLVDELGFSGKNVRICILDAGFNTNHESLRYSKIVSTYDFISKDFNINLQEKDAFGSADHGTAVLSIMSGFLPGKLIGPAYGSDYILARTEDISSGKNINEDLWVSAVEWADSLGADIVLSSAGLMFDKIFDDSISFNNDIKELVIYKIAKIAAERGMLFVSDAPYNYNETLMQELRKSGLDMLFVTSYSGADDLSASGLFDSLFSPSKSVPLVIRSSINDLYTAEAGGDNFYGWRRGSSYVAALAAASAAILIEAHPDWNLAHILESLRRCCVKEIETEDYEGKEAGGFINIFTAMNIVYPSVSCDFDGNGRVDGNDLAIFSSLYFMNPADSGGKKSADLDGNMKVDGDDLAILMSHFANN
jgi:serine protease AprX